MRTLQNLLTLVLFALAVVGVLMALAYLPIDTGFLPAWANNVLSTFPPLDTPAGTIVSVGVIGAILLTAGAMFVTSSVGGRQVRTELG